MGILEMENPVKVCIPGRMIDRGDGGGAFWEGDALFRGTQREKALVPLYMTPGWFLTRVESPPIQSTLS